MVFEKIKNKGEARLFRSSFLETMTKTHPIVIYAIYLPLIVYLLYRGYTLNNLSIVTELGFFLFSALGHPDLEIKQISQCFLFFCVNYYSVHFFFGFWFCSVEAIDGFGDFDCFFRS